MSLHRPYAPPIGLLLLSVILVSCSQDGEPVRPADGAPPGPYVPAHTTLVLEASTRGRALSLEVWYPGEGGATLGASVGEFEALLQSTQPGCPSFVTQVTRDAPAVQSLGDRPLVMFSHC